jgi:S1-C subfamily serine protease
MSELKAGERIRYDGDEIGFRLNLRPQLRLALVTRDGRFVDPETEGEWQVFRTLSRHGDDAEILVFLDDMAVGHANDVYPARIRIGANEWSMPEPIGSLRSIILCQLYRKDGVTRLKASNEGYAFGIDAYARSRNIEPPRRERSAPTDVPGHRDLPPSRGGRGSGSGILVTPTLIVTNEHVLEDATGFRVPVARDACRVIGVDPMHDLALIEGEFSGDPIPVRIGDPVWLGEDIMAAGYPLSDLLGADLKVTGGHVSGLKGLGGDLSRFQFSAPIGSGSSGGAVVDKQGRLVGVTAASLAHQNVRDHGANSENVNFAIKACLVQELLSAHGFELPTNLSSDGMSPRELTNRLRRGVVQIEVAF